MEQPLQIVPWMGSWKAASGFTVVKGPQCLGQSEWWEPIPEASWFLLLYVARCPGGWRPGERTSRRGRPGERHKPPHGPLAAVGIWDASDHSRRAVGQSVQQEAWQACRQVIDVNGGQTAESWTTPMADVQVIWPLGSGEGR